MKLVTSTKTPGLYLCYEYQGKIVREKTQNENAVKPFDLIAQSNMKSGKISVYELQENTCHEKI